MRARAAKRRPARKAADEPQESGARLPSRPASVARGELRVTSPSPGPANQTRLPERNLDVLRATAVMMVFVDHLLTVWLKQIGPLTMWQLGRMGVLLFFVHTSLVLMASLERLEVPSGSRMRFCLAFYLRRAFRIYPLAIVCVLGYLVFRVPAGVPAPGEHLEFVRPNLWELLTNLALVQDLFGTYYIIGPLWSLPIELQMYVLLPFCYLAAKRGVRYVIGLLPLAIIGWIALNVFQLRGLWRLPVLDFGPCFIAGVLAYAVLRRHKVRQLPAWVWPLFIAACIPMLMFMQADSKGAARGWLLCLAVGAFIPFVRDLKPSWPTRASAVVAKYSYGIYLTHVAAIWVPFVGMSGAPLVTRWATFVVLAAGLPIVAYHAVERPMIALGIRISERFRERYAVATEAAAVAPAP
jgi:peptidoglycan/LPS O-acetylase OafA/YrhL